MTQEQVKQHFAELILQIMKTREAGHAEYAGGANAFGNFERLHDDLGMSREAVLWVYLRKHLDGILSYIKGHTSQRESVHGRILDTIVYLMLLDAMITENEERTS